MAKLIDPLKLPVLTGNPEADLKADRLARAEVAASDLLAKKRRGNPLVSGAPIKQADLNLPGLTLEQRVKADFRVFLTLVWRHVLGNDPNPIQLDLAYWLQHGPDRAIIMAFRGFSKSWITGAYALWRLYCNPDEKIMVVSGGLVRAMQTSNWCLGLVMTMDILKDLRPKANNRQSASMWDVGNCIPAQSASFTAFGIGGQLVGFRGTLIIPDDVETQTNSLTTVMREKILEAVKEFESVLTPGGQIKYLGTPHDVDSLYEKLLRLKGPDGTAVYYARVWPALFPTQEEAASYRGRLAPYIEHEIGKLGPSCIGHSTMPLRFTDKDLETRCAAMGKSEFRLQFMLDLSGTFTDRFPLKLKDLMVMDLDANKAPEDLVWGTTHPDRDLPVMGFDGDYYMKPVQISPMMLPYSKKIAFVDPSGRGANETTLTVAGELHGRAFWLYQYATTDGYSPPTLEHIAKSCVRFGVSTLYVEGNFGDGMFLSLMGPVLIRAWEEEHKRRKLANLPRLEQQGTTLVEIKSGSAQKERRILSVLEPVFQQHRLVVDRSVIEADYKSLQSMEGEDTRHYYAWGYQATHITREKDCLTEDDRIEGLAGCLAQLAAELGVDPIGMTRRAQAEREDDLEAELERLEAMQAGGAPRGPVDHRVQAARITKR